MKAPFFGKNMNQIIKTICLVLITLSVIVGVGFYCWDIKEEQEYYKAEEARKAAEEAKYQFEYLKQ